ncbi:SET domain-containing protein SmydA-8-like isoform X2 [Scylla paramamosain]|uniref:SET domain-containing protein SmydA-8-like isoform X2 n=1 Tax=Scylla paramamosain TaxID=85552 RepID=UPI0030830210
MSGGTSPTPVPPKKGGGREGPRPSRQDGMEGSGEEGQEAEVGMCANCGFLAKLRCSNCRQAFYCKRECQREHWKQGHKDQCQPFQVLHSPELGRYMVASRDLKAGDIILREDPIVVGPKQVTEPVCLGCYKRVDGSYRCERCGWPMCGPQCCSSADHQPECVVGQEIGSPIDIQNFDETNHFYEVIFAMRCLALKKRSPRRYEQLLALESHYEDRVGTHVHEQNQKRIVNFLRNYFFLQEFSEEEIDSSERTIHTVTGIMDVNALEIRLAETEILGLFPTFAMMEHSCTPNTRHSFTEERRVVLRAAVDIRRGEHLSTMYTHILWGTAARRDHLKHSKYFMCTCCRCADPTELGTHFSALRCQSCTNGFLLSAAPLDELADWICASCSATQSSEEVTDANLRLGEEVEAALANPELRRLEELVNHHARVTVHPNHFHLFAARHTLLQMYGRDPSAAAPEHMRRKERLCQDFLKVCTALDPGMARLGPYAGVALYEYHLAVLARARGDPDAPQKESAALRKDIETAKALLQQCIRVLQDEPLDQPEGKLCAMAKANLAELRQWEASIAAP